MNELINTQRDTRNSRWQLLATVSSLVLLTSVSGAAAQETGDAGRPLVWIELGGQLSRIDGGEEPYMPPFTGKMIAAGFPSPVVTERPPRYAVGGEGRISFEPIGSDWKFSAAIRYGRSNGDKRFHQSKNITTQYLGYSKSGQRYADVKSHHNETHTVIDFQVGKDVGLGILGSNGTSVFSLGVRIAQLTSKARSKVDANPDFAFDMVYFTGYGSLPLFSHHNAYRGLSESERSFRGVGPSLTWDASARLAQMDSGDAITLDWGINVAALFGRQKSRIHHETIGYYVKQEWTYALSTPIRTTHDYDRTRSIVIPNIGGFAGLSYRFTNAKFSVGYRADIFFNAMDGGQATRDTRNRSFHGPFATISIGLGG